MKFSWKTIFNTVLIVAAYGYLIYTFATFDGYGDLMQHFRNAGWTQIGALAVAVSLIPLNIFFEAFKWRYLLRNLEPMSLAEAQRQVYFGFVGAMLTPERLGDYPTRVTRIEDKSKWLPAITLGFAGTMALSTVNMVGGLLSLLFSGLQVGGANRGKVLVISCSLLAFFVLITLLLPAIARRYSAKQQPQPLEPLELSNSLNSSPETGEVARSDGGVDYLSNSSNSLNLSYGSADRSERSVDKNSTSTWTRLLAVLKDFSPWEFPVLIGLSLLRYAVYGTQLLLVLIFCGVTLTPLQYLTIIPIHYLFVTVVPTVPVADAAVRGSVGVLIFSAFTSNSAGVAIAAIILWLLNTIVPTVVGTMVNKPCHCRDNA